LLRNPLWKRYKRELKSDFGKYIAIALFMIMLIGLVSGYLVVADSIEKTFYEGWEKYNIEDGHITFSQVPTEELLSQIEEKAKLTFYDLEYIDEDIDTNGTTLRIFKIRTEVDKSCLIEGEMPKASDEIAVDRLFAKNNGLQLGDTVTLNGMTIKVTGYIALVDYNCLFEKNTDMMMNANIFGVAEMTEDGYKAINSIHVNYNYAWKYKISCSDKKEENSRSEELLDVLEEVIKDYDEAIVQAELETLYKNASNPEELASYELDEDKLLTVENYVPRYQNKAVTFCMDDMKSDKPSFIIFAYIVVVILAFVFAVNISSSIQQEAGVIGTLRASGYSRGELVRHFLFMPTIVTLLAAIIGNILGYTFFVDYMKNVFYTSFSLATYESVFNTEAFVITTVVPILLMIAINLYMLNSKLKLSPIRFLRRDLDKKKKRRAVLLNKKWPFMSRFRLRILFQNVSAYITLTVGIIFGGIIAIFGFMFGPLLIDYADLIVSEKICDYQYILMNQVETSTEGAEKYCIDSLELSLEGYLTDEISIYGISDDSIYIKKDIPEGKVLVSDGILAKYGLNPGDTLILQDPYSDKTYDFIIADSYPYSAALAVFMNMNEYIERFDKKENYFTGYLSNTEITDIDSMDIVSVITESDLTKVSDQMMQSVGSFMALFRYFGAIMLALLMYLMTKQVIEKNAQSIAMTKILGFTNKEIAGLYLAMTGFVALIALVIAIPVTDVVLRLLFEKVMYTQMSGYLPYIVSKSCYVYTALITVGCFVVVSAFMFVKIGKIRKSEALKNVE